MGYADMSEEEKREYAKWVGFGMILGVAIGTMIDILWGNFTGVISAIGAGLGIVAGAAIAHQKLASS